MPTSERIDRYQYCPNVSVNLAILPAFLEVLVDALVRDRGQECHIGHADLLLLEALLPIGLVEMKAIGMQANLIMLYRTFATFVAALAPPFLGVAAFFPAFFDIAYGTTGSR